MTDPQVVVQLGRPARLVVSGPDGLAAELWPDPEFLEGRATLIASLKQIGLP